GFAKLELGIEQDAELGAASGEAHGDGRAGSVAESKTRPARGDDPQRARVDKPFQRRPKQPVHRPLPPSDARHARDTIAVHPAVGTTDDNAKRGNVPFWTFGLKQNPNCPAMCG